MSVRKLTARIFGSLVVLCGLATSASAQEHAPVADPFQFDPDFRWFEPIYGADLADMKPSKRANTGWFATYDRLNLYGSRPETNAPQLSDTKLDGGWGHRYEIGYMLPDADHGWVFNWTELNVDETENIRHFRFNIANEDENGGTPTNPVAPFGREGIPFFPNNSGFPFRFVDEGRVLNKMKVDSYEMNKTWRMEPYHYGGILEPLVGVRWSRLEDTQRNDDYDSSAFQDVIGTPNLVDTFGANAEKLDSDWSVTDNELLAGQIGFRYTKFRDRFTFSSDFKVFGGNNWQENRSWRTSHVILYDGTDGVIGLGQDPTAELRPEAGNTRAVYERNEEFVVGFDLRGELGYQLTKAITVRGGFQLVNFGTGLWRGGNQVGRILGGDQDQDYQLLGASFGVTLNR